MGYQALLFCPDEKLSRVIGQIFTELDFMVDPANDSSAAAEKLKARHYDAVVVDCDNEETSAPLLKSAHNSSLNQSALAIAVVEGQAGIAKAYRIGANLVLTKPINVEQAKGTLRVARGLLRKSADSAIVSGATSATPAAWPAPVGRSLSIEVTNRNAEAAPVPAHKPPPDFDASLLAMEAVAKIEEKLASLSTTAAQKQAPVAAHAPTVASPLASSGAVVNAVAKTEILKPGSNPVFNNASISQSGAAAPAPAKEAAAPAKKQVEEEEQQEFGEETAAPAQAYLSTSSAKISEAPAFAALGDKDAGGSGASKKVLIAAVAFVALATAGYFGWTKFGETRSHPSPPPVTTSPQKGTDPVQEVRPMSAPAPAPSAGTVNRASAVTPAPAPENSSTQPDQLRVDSSVTKISVQSENEPKANAAAPLLVRSATPAAKTPEQPEEPSPPLPSPLTVASSSDSGLNSVLSAVSSNVPKPTLVRVKVSQGVSQGLVIKRVQPRYPANALAGHIQGAVEIEATINKEGNVLNPRVVRGNPTLAAAALEAVRQWRYKPYYLDGQPVEIQTQITINFKAN